jgi:hypothetical protein
MRGGSLSKAGQIALGCAAGLLLALPACAQQPALPQQAAPAGGDLQKQVDALRGQVQAMQKDLDEIKALLAPLRRQQPTIPADLVIDLGHRPIKGDPAAKLTFLELTDYQ